MVRTSKMGLWWSAVPKAQWPEDPGFLAMMEPYLDPVWGDRRQEIVFIGADPMDRAALEAELEDCLVEATEFTPDRWRALPDPFAEWSARVG